MKHLLILILALFSFSNLSYAAVIGDCTTDNVVDITDVVCTIDIILNPVENTPALCSDGGDNDADGATDCADTDCQNLPLTCPAACQTNADCGMGQTCDFSNNTCI